jgi:hypothetical protein
MSALNKCLLTLVLYSVEEFLLHNNGEINDFVVSNIICTLYFLHTNTVYP